MTKYVYIKTGHTGGGVDDLDGISRTVLADKDICHVYDGSGQAIPYEYQLGETDAEQATTRPRRIRPDDYDAGSPGVWYEQEAGGIMRQGTSTFNSTTGRTITLDPVAPNTNYQVLIEQQAESGFIGETTVKTKATNSFVVENSGSDVTTAFGWTLINV